MGQKVLVIGSGAREHAIAHTLLKGDSVEEVTVAPGNPGMEADGIRVVQINPSNQAAMIDFAQANDIDWVFVGPEVPLIEGIVDMFADAGIPAFGPSKAAAQIEGSKDFAKKLMDRHGIPTAKYATFAELEPAAEYVREHGAPIVVKADGLAAGKGVTVAMDVETALAALDDIFVDHRFGNAGAKVVIEDYLEGQEFSLMSFVNGTDFWPMPISQDHKRAYDNDEGPNTGGMGAYSPVPQIADETVAEAIGTIVRPTVEAMAAEGAPFTGILYAGLIATADGPKVIEFNARFGDPETEVVLPRLKSDLGAAIWTILQSGDGVAAPQSADDIVQTGSFPKVGAEPVFAWDTDGATIGVVLASDGYPGDVVKGAPVPDFGDLDDETHVYYAGVGLAPDERTASDDSRAASAGNGVAASGGEEAAPKLVANSGRVLLVETSAPTIAEAQRKIYDILDAVDTPGLFYRHDIAAKALR
ncbi:phosphoribosylamine--glycine ligase [Bifidobacterium choloepi]|uniref:Phosphoribosylamine--glycine ligase n=1 Tax=Bifidobacterium choloepi TaxID=2614131 RepID=A0A6I5NKR2_9BIFI|nr:phosphoribosylamine--glycine ligase [Bifidobacterium choloepi]NEG69432.1 phosphoribosylamine--glycine ligase [Bifidobacterium choloepi]